ncbi:DUF2513 domain-containing protein [Spongiibacter sp. UBA1325]|uniref:DUF2513 domain-containing protein n=1 Tax=Spongiibacter sp. UBA1325 TaxID=1947543 RepID=UPI00257CAE24|nr:DUF2513 domain-containing protein [Spongiibacter sp. UBA1325]|tara:strand:+ start:490 stop:861 length:372 start_codon:yes stop_codon:yes gene_type:complete
MKRDMGLVRKILLAVEANEPPLDVPGFEKDLILYNMQLVIEAGLAEGSVQKNLSSTSQSPSAVVIRKLTWQGHEFIDLMKREEIWSTIQREFKEASFATIIKVGKDLAEGWAKKRVNQLLNND